jgi:hypothetical protein
MRLLPSCHLGLVLMLAFIASRNVMAAQAAVEWSTVKNGVTTVLLGNALVGA